tara:strand:- start:5676 stop:5888 length:213 start_codon:yes stop_codon:yes gene_type:complete
MKKINSGDLVYIPAEVVLRATSADNSRVVERWVKLDKPKSLLVTNVYEEVYQVYYENKNWLVEKNKVYEV